MRMVIDKHLGGGEWERVGIAEAKAEQRQDTPEAKAEQRQDAPDAVQLWWLRDWMEAESGGNPVPAAFDALDVTEVADYRVYPEGAENSPGFYRLTSDGTIAEIESAHSVVGPRRVCLGTIRACDSGDHLAVPRHRR